MSNQDNLNRASPVNDDIKMGDLLAEVLASYNDLATKYNLLLAKLDGDAGVTDVNYASTLAATDASLKSLEER